jgi:hypothetical protein
MRRSRGMVCLLEDLVHATGHLLDDQARTIVWIPSENDVPLVVDGVELWCPGEHEVSVAVSQQ